MVVCFLQTALCQGPYNVECELQQESCECNELLDTCYFRLDIEELQTFTSYPINEEDGGRVTGGRPGDNFFLNSTGFIPSLPPPRQTNIVEYGPCWAENLTTLENFREINCSAPMLVDGYSYRAYIAVNGQLPGPTLIVHEEQNVWVDVYNQLTNEVVTIHWHGMHQKGTPWMDGVGFISQAPITPGAVFQYRFLASPAGTHWYHSHVGAQRTDGLFGSLIVREKNATLQRAMEVLGDFEDTPEKHTLSLMEFDRELSLSTFVKIRSTLGFYPDKPLERVPLQNDVIYHPWTSSTDGTVVGRVPYWSGLINGKGRLTSDTYSLLSIFNVEPDKAYRFRVVGAQRHFAYKIEVEGHKLTVVATDGHFIQPVEADYLIVHTGERYDFILNATQPPDNYLIRARTLEVANPGGDPDDYEFLNNTAEAVLHYDTRGVQQPDPLTMYSKVNGTERECTSTERCKAVNCPFKEFPNGLNIDCIPTNELRALFESNKNDLPTITNDEESFLIFNFGFDGENFKSSINGRRFVLPSTPYQTYPGQFDYDRENDPKRTCQQCQEMADGTTRNCRCTQTVQIASGQKFREGNEDSIIMVFSSATFSHPIHLHGHSFYVVHVEHGEYNNGILTSPSGHIHCNGSCLDPQWNGTGPDLSQYTTDDGKLNGTAILKDTVIVPAGGYVVIAFLADNPGYWYLHCHIESHQLEGMALIVQEYPEGEHAPPPSGINRVGNFLWQEEEEERASRVNGWMIGAIVAIALFLLAVAVVIGLAVCVKFQRKRRESYDFVPGRNYRDYTPEQSASHEC